MIQINKKRTSRQKALKNQVNRLDCRIVAMQALSRRCSWYRLLIFLIGGAAVFITAFWISETLSWILFALFLIVFNIVAYFHRRLERGIKRHQIWLKITKNHLARMKLDWEKISEPNLKLPFSDLPFEIDLDITGKRSLHQLIDISISQEGSQRLAGWLLQQEPNLDGIEKRQRIIGELIPLTRFRNKLLLNFHLVSEAQLEGRKLLTWLKAESPASQITRRLLISMGFIIINIGLFLWQQLGDVRPYWIISLFTYFIFYLNNHQLLQQLFETIFHLDDELAKFRQILKYLESYPYGNKKYLKQLCQPFLVTENLPSKQLRKIKLVTTAIGLRMNPIMGIILNVTLPWDFFFATRILRYRNEMAELLPQWLNTWAKLEALISLANFAYLNPEFKFPEIITERKENHSILAAKGLGHPLIPAEQKVCNDFSLKRSGEVFIITGSNMSGKSTFLKTLGVNLCLAYAGSVVNASSFQAALFRVFTSIKINDSIVDGFSFFYAEVKRLRALLDALQQDHPFPLFFLIDEIFKGTNNRERLIGSRSYLQALVGQNGAGLIATHDLELIKLADQFVEISNYHFREEVMDGKMVFDYKLHPGPCPTTNALKIMKMEGLPVELDD